MTMKSADYDELRWWASDMERQLWRDLRQADENRPISIVIATASWFVALGMSSVFGTDSWATVITAVVIAPWLTYRASGNYLNPMAQKLSVISKLIGMEHYASAIRWSSLSDADFQRWEKLKTKGIPLDEIVKKEEQIREENRVSLLFPSR